jgi:hypothetical protein
MEPRHANSSFHQFVLERTIIVSSEPEKMKGSAILEHFRQFSDLRRIARCGLSYGKATFTAVAPSRSGDNAPTALPFLFNDRNDFVLSGDKLAFECSLDRRCRMRK